MPATLEPTACACVKCGTVAGRRHPWGTPRRYRAARFGLVGMICDTCRNRLSRHEVAWAKGRVPGQVGRPITKARKPDAMGLMTEGERVAHQAKENASEYIPTPEQIAENARAEREAWGQEQLLAKEAKDDERRRSHARRAEIERAEIVRKRNRLNRVGLGVLRTASL